MFKLNFFNIFIYILIIIDLPQGIISQNVTVQKQTSQPVFTEPPTPACHASTIVVIGKKSLLSAWFGGSYEGAPDVSIYTALYKNGKWEKPVKVAGPQVAGPQVTDSITYPCWNPVLFKSKKGLLYLFYHQGKNPREWWGMVMTSKDNGVHWSEPKPLPKGFLGPIKNKPVQLSNGIILCPSSTESLDEKTWQVHMELFYEQKDSWQKVLIDTSSSFGVIQPTILCHPKGLLQILCRSRQNLVIESWSADNGQSWSRLAPIELPNPNSGIDAISLKNGKYLLVYNPLISGSDWYIGRNVLKLAISDDGRKWKDIAALEDAPNSEYSYPAIIQTPDRKIHITYTDNRKSIKYVHLKIKQD